MTLLRWVLPDSLELSAYLDQRAREVRGADGVLEAGVHLGFGCIVVSEILVEVSIIFVNPV
jgi:hypothetical protein